MAMAYRFRHLGWGVMRMRNRVSQKKSFPNAGSLTVPDAVDRDREIGVMPSERGGFHTGSKYR